MLFTEMFYECYLLSSDKTDGKRWFIISRRMYLQAEKFNDLPQTLKINIQRPSSLT